MSVTWVGGTTLVKADSATSVSANTPSGLADDDTLVAFVFARSAITPPAGWTLVEASGAFTGSSTTQYLSAYGKDAVTSADASASFTFTQASSGRMGVVYAAARNGSIVASASNVVNNTVGDTDTRITPEVLTASSSGELIVLAASTVLDIGTAQTPTAPAGSTLFSGASQTHYRLCASYIARNSGESNSGYFEKIFPGVDGGNGSITLRLSASAALEGYISAEGPLGAPALLGAQSVGSILAAGPLGDPALLAAHAFGSILLDGPLGAPSLVGAHTFGSVLLDGPLGAPRLLGIHSFALMSAPGPLVDPTLLAWRDFTADLDPYYPQRYVMDLQTPDGLVRVPISSWQATIQARPTADEEAANYVQCVVPGCARWLESIAAATGFVISRVGRLADGGLVEYEMAQAPLDATAIDGGATNRTATLSGYAPGLPVAADNPDSLFDRTLTNVRQDSIDGANRRARADIDWLLRPGQRAFVQGSPMIVRYINYYVSGTDQSMFVGSQST